MAEGNRVRSGGEARGAGFDREAGRTGGGWHDSRRATGPHATVCDTVTCRTAARRTGVCHWAATRWWDGQSCAGGPVRAGSSRTGAVGTGPVRTGVAARGDLRIERLGAVGVGFARRSTEPPCNSLPHPGHPHRGRRTT